MTVTEEAPVVVADAEADPKPARKVKSGADRRPRGWLESDVKKITDQFSTGKVTLEEGQYMTPHRVALMVKDLDSLDEAPSTGAVAAVFKRWQEIGFASFNDKPFAFKEYTTAGIDEGLTALKASRAEKRRADRKAAKEAEKAAAATA